MANKNTKAKKVAPAKESTKKSVAKKPVEKTVKAPVEKKYAKLSPELDKLIQGFVKTKSELIEDGSSSRVRKINSCLDHLKRAKSVLI